VNIAVGILIFVFGIIVGFVLAAHFGVKVALYMARMAERFKRESKF